MANGRTDFQRTFDVSRLSAHYGSLSQKGHAGQGASPDTL